MFLYYSEMGERDKLKSRISGPLSIEVPEGQVRVLESHHSVDFEMELSSWAFHKICWVAVGKGLLETPVESTSIRANDFLLLPAEWPHRFVDDRKDPLTLVILCISKQFLCSGSHGELQDLWEVSIGQGTVGEPLRARTAFHQSSLVEGFRLALQEQGNERPGWKTATATVATRLILNFARGYCEAGDAHRQSSLRAVEGVIEYMNSNVYRPLTIDQMAAKSHISPRRFTTLFKQATGKTFSDYLNQKRIEYACKRLDETGHILYACHSAGFNDLAYFYRVFKKLTGLTPGEYLRK